MFDAASTADFTGSRITSDKPISVLSGNKKVAVGASGSSDHLTEQVPPVNTLGKAFYSYRWAGLVVVVVVVVVDHLTEQVPPVNTLGKAFYSYRWAGLVVVVVVVDHLT